MKNKKIKLIITCIFLFLIFSGEVKAAHGDLMYDITSFEMDDTNKQITIEGWAFIHKNHNVGGETLKIAIVTEGNINGKKIKSEYSEDKYDNGDSLFPLMCYRNSDHYCWQDIVDATCNEDEDETSACLYRDTGFSIDIGYGDLAKYDNNSEIQFYIKVEYSENTGAKYDKDNSTSSLNSPKTKKLAVSKSVVENDKVEYVYGVYKYNLEIGGLGETFDFKATDALYQALDAGNKISASGDNGKTKFTTNKKYNIVGTDLLSDYSWKIDEDNSVKVKNIRIYNLNTITVDGTGKNYWAYATWGQISGEVKIKVQKEVVSEDEPISKTCSNPVSNGAKGCLKTISKVSCEGYTLKASKIIPNQSLYYDVYNDNSCSKPEYVYYRDVSIDGTIEYNYGDITEYNNGTKKLYNGGPFAYSSVITSIINIKKLPREVYFIKYQKKINGKCQTYYNVLKDSEDINLTKGNDLQILNDFKNKFSDYSDKITQRIENIEFKKPTSTSNFSDSNGNRKKNTTGAVTAFNDATSDSVSDSWSGALFTKKVIWNINLKYSYINRQTGAIYYRKTLYTDTSDKYLDDGKELYYVPTNYKTSNTKTLNGQVYYIFPATSKIDMNVKFAGNLDIKSTHTANCKVYTYNKLLEKNYLINYRVVDLNKMFPNVLPYGYRNVTEKYGYNWYNWIKNYAKIADNVIDKVNSGLADHFATANKKVEYSINLTKKKFNNILKNNAKATNSYADIKINIKGNSNFVTNNFTKRSLNYTKLGESGLK